MSASVDIEARTAAQQQALALLADTMWPGIHEDTASAAATRHFVQNSMYIVMVDRQWWVHILGLPACLTPCAGTWPARNALASVHTSTVPIVSL